MPTAGEAKTKFEEFLDQLTQSQSALAEQKSKYSANIESVEASLAARFDTILSGFDENKIEMLEDALDTADADWSAPQYIAEMHTQSRENEAKAAKLEQNHGSSDAINKRLKDLQESIKPFMKQNRISRLFLDIYDRHDVSGFSLSALEHSETRMATDVEYGHRALQGIKDYNEYARENDLEEITSENFRQFRKSMLWHGWNGLSQDPAIRAQAMASKCIKSRKSFEVYSDLVDYEKSIQNLAVFRGIKENIADTQGILEELAGYQDKVLDQASMQALMRKRVQETLTSNKEFRMAFAEQFGEDGQDIIAAYSKAVLLGQLHDNIAKQERSVGKAIDDLKEGLRKLGKVSSYKKVKVDLEKIEKSIEEGTYDIELYVGKMDDRRARVNSFEPSRSTNHYDDGMYFNYLMLYVVLADSMQFDAGNHDMSRDLSAQFGASLPDLASLDIDNFNLNTGQMSIPGIDIGASVDISSSLSSISSSMPSPSDYGGGYSGGGYDGGGGFSGGFDGGGGF